MFRVSMACSVALALTLARVPSAFGDSWFEGAGLLAGGQTSEMRAISADGTLAAGQARDSGGTDHLVIWTRSGGLWDAGVAGGFDFVRGRGIGVDSTGTVHVCGYGRMTNTAENRAFHWSGEDEGDDGVYTVLPTFGGDESIARGMRVMADDDVRLVGFATNGAGKKQAFRWRKSDGNMLNLDIHFGSDDSNTLSDAWGISNSGGKIAGFAQMSASDHAFHFTTAGDQGMWNFTTGRGRGLSGDGSWVVGGHSGAGANNAFRWDWNGGLGSAVQELGTGTAYGSSVDGSVIVGDDGSKATIWDAGAGWRDLKTELEGVYGLDLAGWEELTNAWGISDDGLTIAGTGIHDGVTEGWVAHLEQPVDLFVRADSNADGNVDLSDPVHVLNYLFTGGPAPGCLKSADSNDSGGDAPDLSDPVYLLSYLFLGGPEPPPPFDECGTDPTADGDDLSCEAFPRCRGPQ